MSSGIHDHAAQAFGNGTRGPGALQLLRAVFTSLTIAGVLSACVPHQEPPPEQNPADQARDATASAKQPGYDKWQGLIERVNAEMSLGPSLKIMSRNDLSREAGDCPALREWLVMIATNDHEVPDQREMAIQCLAGMTDTKAVFAALESLLDWAEKKSTRGTKADEFARRIRQEYGPLVALEHADMDGRERIMLLHHAEPRGWYGLLLLWAGLPDKEWETRALAIRRLLEECGIYNAQASQYFGAIASEPQAFLACGSGLHKAAAACDDQTLRQLVLEGADPNALDPGGNTPLHWAATGCGPASLRILLTGGALVNARNNAGMTPLHKAAQPRSGREDVIAALVQHGADVSAKDAMGYTPLHMAAGYGLEGSVALLLDAGANIDSKNVVGETALHRACYAGNAQTVRVLLARGADVHAEDMFGWTPIRAARSFGRDEIASLLAEAGPEQSEDPLGNAPAEK